MTEATPLMNAVPVAQAPASGVSSVASPGGANTAGSDLQQLESNGDFAALMAEPTDVVLPDPAAALIVTPTAEPVVEATAATGGGNALPFSGVALPLDVLATAGRVPRGESPSAGTRAAVALSATATTAAATGGATPTSALADDAAATGALAALPDDGAATVDAPTDFADLFAGQWTARGEDGALRGQASAPAGVSQGLHALQSQAVGGYGDIAARAPGDAVPQMQIPVPVDDPGFGDAVSAKVLWQAGQQIQGAQLLLNPPALGPVEVRIEMNNDVAQVHFVAHHGTTREELEDAMPRLRDMFAHAGVQLGDTSVSAQANGGQRSFDSGGDAGATGGTARDGRPGEAEELPAPRSRLRLGLVDAYV